MEEYSIVDALVELRPGAEWSIESRDYNKLTWLDTSQTKPTLDELNVKLTEMNSGEAMKQLRRQRNRKLAESDWTQISDVSLETRDKWKEYRQLLRNLPASTHPSLGPDNRLNPATVTWPTPHS